MSTRKARHWNRPGPNSSAEARRMFEAFVRKIDKLPALRRAHEGARR
jgi:hypothetical protein